MFPSEEKQSEAAVLSREQIADFHRRAKLIDRELESATGSLVRARVERGGGAVLVAAPESKDGRGFYSVQARLIGKDEVTVYVPDSVSLTDGAVIEVVEGQYGHYFRAIVGSGQ
jgi:hypothetical protein